MYMKPVSDQVINPLHKILHNDMYYEVRIRACEKVVTQSYGQIYREVFEQVSEQVWNQTKQNI
jgi:hypothetical protein